ncbi:cell death in tomato 1 [Ampelomyces quisqualis]|uniref:Cell death in tomato 1 n=1 Tax=Ampelomyces quisqualis TaxID=50730 RepID=A0A6A5QSW7_AMPQU|nr:cell death in tomato 1 [Ampelomyces quisqualis]
MQFTTTALAASLAFTSAVAASLLEARQNATLKDWEVTSAGSFTPSGRPGSYPWVTITANITDPNEINLGEAESDGKPVTVPAGSKGVNCIAKYFTKNRESPLGRTWPCDSIEGGYWTMEVLAGSLGSYSPNNFKLKFRHVADLIYQGAQYTTSFEAEGSFEVGKNLKGTCGGSGVCSWGLPEGQRPFHITPGKV